MSRKIYKRVGLPSGMWEQAEVAAKKKFLTRHLYLEKLLAEDFERETQQEKEMPHAKQVAAH